MNKAKANFIVDFLAFISFLATALSGFALMIFMPGGVRQGRFQEFLGVEKGLWSAAHNISGIMIRRTAVTNMRVFASIRLKASTQFMESQ